MLFIAIIVSGICFWFNMYRANKFVLTRWMKVFAGVILGLGIAFSITLGIWANGMYALTAILLLPVAALAFAVFIGMWSTNDYQLYEPIIPNANQVSGELVRQRSNVGKSIKDE